LTQTGSNNNTGTGTAYGGAFPLPEMIRDSIFLAAYDKLIRGYD
jgi:hypothetical protein